MKKLGLIIIAPALGLMVSLLSPPAQADTLSFTDGTSTTSGIDINKVRVRHEERLTVTVRHEDVDRGDVAGITMWIDNRPAREGAEFVYQAGIGGDSDYYLRRARGWNHAEDMPMTCWYGLDMDYRNELTRIPISRDCLGDHDRVRVSVRAELWQDENDVIRDWAPDRHEWSAWVRRG